MAIRCSWEQRHFVEHAVLWRRVERTRYTRLPVERSDKPVGVMFRPLCSGWGLEFDLSSKDRLCEPEGVLGRRGSYLPTVAWLTSTPSLRFAMDARCALVRISQENFLQGANPCRKP